MKTFAYLQIVFALLFCLISCSKKTSVQGCTAQYVAPTIKFILVDKTNGNDLFFSASPNYSINELKMRFKNQANKLDSITPAIEVSGNNTKHFVYSVPALRSSDTCYVQIKGLISNSIYYVISKDSSPCQTPFVSMVKVDNENIINYKTNDVITIKK